MPTPWMTSPRRSGWRSWMGAERNLRRQRRGPGVVGINPVGVCFFLKPGIGSRRLLDARRSVFSARFKPTKRIRDTVTLDAFEATRKHGGVFDRHGGALCHVRRHRMAGVAEQRHVPVRPASKGIAIDDRPFLHIGASGQYIFDLAITS